MAWPTTPLPVRVDLQIGGVWTNVTTDTLVRAGITINRGRADEASRADAQVCNLTFKNADGKYSSRNPTSPYYGILGRNTPLRVGIGTPALGAGTANQTGVSIVAPSVTAEAAGAMFCAWTASPVGNITVPGGFTASGEVDGTLTTSRTAAKLIAAGATGTATATHSVAAASAAALTVVVPGVTGAVSATAIATLGNGVSVTTGAVAVGDYVLVLCGWSSDPYNRMAAIGDTEGGNEWYLIADTGASTGPRIRAYIRRVTVAGALNFGVFGDGLGTIDVFGSAWALTGTTDYYPRFVGEVSQWPSTWDLSGKDVYVPVQASGVKRRLAGGAGGATPLRSAAFRKFSTMVGVVGYWPLEDGAISTSFASSLPGGSPMAFLGPSSPVPAAYEGVECSSAIPTFTAAGAYGAVPTYTSTNEFAAGALMYFPLTGMVDESGLMAVYATGTIRTWTLKFEAGSAGFRLEAYTSAGVSVLNTPVGPWPPGLLGGRFFVYISAAPSGADVAWVLRFVPIVNSGDGTAASLFVSGTILAQTVGAVTGVAVGNYGDLAGDPAIGHVVVTSTANAMFTGSVYSALGAHRSEPATSRFLRLCEEESVPATIKIFPTSEAMGPQRTGTLLDLLAECEVTDDSVVVEPKGFLGLILRTRSSKYNQTAEVTLSYSGGNISEPFEPTDDDRGIVNDVTVSRAEGSSARSEQTTGPLSTQPPPVGVGRYNSNTVLNVNEDTQLPDQASWRLHVGTWDEARYPNVRVNLPKNPSLAAAVTGLDIGDLVSLTNLPAWVPPGPADVILEGYTETIGHPIAWDLTGNFSPAGPYRVGVYGASSRYSSDLSILNGAATSTATSISVASAGPPWITTASHPAEFPFDITIGGEQMTVTAIVNATSPQTFTVTRSVNGVVKAQTSASVVALYRPAYYAL